MATPPDSRNRPEPGTSAGGEDGAGLGELLKRAREQRGFTVQQVSNQTKIPRRHLEALERDDLSALPVGFYQRAEVRAYAKAVNLDQNLALAKLDLAYKPSTSRASRSGSGVASSSSTGQWLLILVSVLAAAWFLFRSMNGGPAPPTPDIVADMPATSRVPSTGDPTRADAEAPAARTPPADAPVAAAEPAVPNLVPAPAAPALDVVTTEAAPRDAAAAVVPGSTSPVPAPSPDLPPAVLPPPQPAAALVLVSEPAGASVTVNGIGWGVTPVSIRYLPAGDKRIRISKDGYVTDERVISIVEGRPARVSIQLQAAP